jgi:hypothetical protein
MPRIFLHSPARSRWPKEVRDLTPWVRESLVELGHTLGLTLKPIGTEVAVGIFRADIAATDDSGRCVIMENQLGPSDHIHFGQVVLYAPESKVDIIVWLVAVDLRSFIVPESDGIVFVYRSNYEGLLGKRVRRLPDRGPP